MKMMIQLVDLMHPLVQVTMFKRFLKMRNKLLLGVQLFCSTLIKNNWEGRGIKILFNYLPEDSNYLKLIWVNTKKVEGVFIKNCPKEYKKK